MSTAEIKIEIQQVLDKVPEDALQDVLNYLKGLQSHSPNEIKLANNIQKILSENRGLLERLAQ